MTDDWKRMAGTEGTDKYVVIARNSRGDRIGIRPLDDGSICRVRVEPIDLAAAKELQDNFPVSTWKQPGEDGQLRFSLVTSGDAGIQAVLDALDALKAVSDGTLERNRAIQAWTWRSLFI
jgi:hypothetical protein